MNLTSATENQSHSNEFPSYHIKNTSHNFSSLFCAKFITTAVCISLVGIGICSSVGYNYRLMNGLGIGIGLIGVIGSLISGNLHTIDGKWRLLTMSVLCIAMTIIGAFALREQLSGLYAGLLTVTASMITGIIQYFGNCICCCFPKS